MNAIGMQALFSRRLLDGCLYLASAVLTARDVPYLSRLIIGVKGSKRLCKNT